MPSISVPNVSEGADHAVISALAAAVTEHACRVLDVHSDRVHARSVYTISGADGDLPAALAAMASEAHDRLDLTTHAGVHPRVGVLDVCPVVPLEGDMSAAVRTALEVARCIAGDVGIPVYLYGAASPRGLELPDIRRGGLAALTERALSDLPPDLGTSAIDPRTGVVCVGARGALIAFNVWLSCEVGAAREIAASVRGQAVRALGLRMSDGVAQVSMNLVDPATVGIDRAFELVAGTARQMGIEVTATEIVGLVPQRFRPDPGREAARLLREPGRSLESELAKG